MAKVKKERAENYEEKLAVNSTLENLIAISVSKPKSKKKETAQFEQSVFIDSLNKKNGSMCIKDIFAATDKPRDSSPYFIDFIMNNQGRRQWEYESKSQRDDDLAKIRAELANRK